MSRVFRLTVFVAVLGALPAILNGQDLGSSNKLFGGAKTTAKTVKKATPKHKPTVVKTAPAAKKRSPAPKSSAKTTPKTTPKATPKTDNTNKKPSTTAASKPKFTEFHNTKIEVGNSGWKEIKTPVTPANEAQFEKLIHEGNVARDARNYIAAESAYKRAGGVKPRDPRAIYGLGNLYSDQQRWEVAEKSFRAALQIEPSDAVARIALSYVLSQPIAVANLSDRYEEAEKLARQAIELAPANPLAFDQLGVALELRGLISSETEKAYRRAIQLDPSFAPAYAHLGRLLRRRGMTNESAAAYQSAVQRSTDIGTMIVVADVMQSEQRYVESEQLLRSALDRDPRNPSALILLARALMTKGGFADAETLLKRSVSVTPDGFLPYSLLGTLYTRQGNFDLAENALLQALRFVPSSEKRRLSWQFEAVGDGYVKGGRGMNAERPYRQALNLDSGNAALIAKLAKAHG